MRRKLLFIFTQVFADGGIQRFNQTLVSASKPLDADFEILSLRDIQSFDVQANIHVTSFAGDQLKFARAVFRAVRWGDYTSILVGHINFIVLVASAFRYRVRRRPRIMLVTHGIDAWTNIKGLRRRALRAVDQILCVSHYTQSRIEQQAPEFPRSHYVLFPNALNSSWGQLGHGSSGAGSSGSRFCIPERFILSVSRLSHHDRYKGIATVLETLPMLEDSQIHYVIAGDGDDRGFLQWIASEFEARERVHFMGAVPDGELAELYRRCTAFVLPSGKEGFGLVYLEAMYFGAPVVAAAEKGVLDVVEDERNGLLVPFGDTVRLKAALDRLIADRALRAILTSKAKTSVTDGGMFTFEAFANRWAELLQHHSIQDVR
jgi:glycosyltransferase involved in cell wall biosynthesis